MVGTAACRPSTINFAASALKELEKAITVFEAGANHPIARNGLVCIFSLFFPRHAHELSIILESYRNYFIDSETKRMSPSRLVISKARLLGILLEVERTTQTRCRYPFFRGSLIARSRTQKSWLSCEEQLDMSSNAVYFLTGLKRCLEVSRP